MENKKIRIPSKYSEKVKQLVEQLIAEGLSVRFEKGKFKSSDCIVNGVRTVIINKTLTNEKVIPFLKNIYDSIPTSQLPESHS